MKEDMSEYLNNSYYSDFKVICSDKVELNLHRLILDTNDFFKAMLANNMSEKRNNEVHLPENSKILKEIFRRIYGGKGLFLSNYQELLFAANKYLITSLETECKMKIMACLNVENAIETLILADDFGNEAFLKGIYEFVGRYMINVKKTVGWKLMDDPKYSKLKDKIIDAYINVISAIVTASPNKTSAIAFVSPDITPNRTPSSTSRTPSSTSSTPDSHFSFRTPTKLLK